MLRKPLWMALLSGVLAMLFAALYLNSLELKYSKTYESISVLVAKQYIDQGTVLDGSLVEERAIPKNFIQPKALRSTKELKNAQGQKSFLTIVPIEQGEQVLATKLLLLGYETGISSLVPQDKRAITLVFDRQGVQGILRPGNRTDIVGVFDFEDREGRLKQASATILQNILILAVGSSYLGATRTGGLEKTEEERQLLSEPTEGRIPVSFAVSPREAELLVLASEKGSIHCSLRAIADGSIVTIPGARLHDLMKDIATAVPINRESKISSTTSETNKEKQKEVLELLKKYRQ